MIVILENVPDVVGDVLIDQDDTNVVAGREVLECLLHLLQLRILLDDQEVRSLSGAMSNACQEESGDGILEIYKKKSPERNMTSIRNNGDDDQRMMISGTEGRTCENANGETQNRKDLEFPLQDKHDDNRRMEEIKVLSRVGHVLRLR